MQMKRLDTTISASKSQTHRLNRPNENCGGFFMRKKREHLEQNSLQVGSTGREWRSDLRQELHSNPHLTHAELDTLYMFETA